MLQVPLDRAHEAAGTAVVIDVLRAFTTEAVAFAGGARDIRLVDEVATALALRDDDPDVLLMGEVDGQPVAGFDLSNSPTEVAAAELAGRRIVHRSSAGTRGAVGASGAHQLVAASFVTAEATVEWLAAHASATITYVITGQHSGRDGDEDRACADYLAARLGGDRPDPAPYLARVRASDAAARFGAADHPWLPAADVDVACSLDRFDFPLPVHRTDDGLVIAAPSRWP